jgi:SnoaL-like domain
MSYSISILLKRNLQDLFGEGDPERRRAAIDEIYTEDVVFYDPSKGVYRGRDEIDRLAGVLRATHPDFTYQLIAESEELGNGGRVLAMRRHTPERISSSPGTAGLPPFISSSTSCPEPGPRLEIQTATGRAKQARPQGATSSSAFQRAL